MVLKSNRLRLTAATFLVCCFAVFALFALGCGDKNGGSGVNFTLSELTLKTTGADIDSVIAERFS